MAAAAGVIPLATQADEVGAARGPQAEALGCLLVLIASALFPFETLSARADEPRAAPVRQRDRGRVRGRVLPAVVLGALPRRGCSSRSRSSTSSRGPCSSRRSTSTSSSCCACSGSSATSQRRARAAAARSPAGAPAPEISSTTLQIARVLSSVFTLLFISTGLIYTCEHEVNPQIPDFFVALYFGLTTLTTVGFGDITPVTVQGKLVVCFSILVGIAVIPLQLTASRRAHRERPGPTAAPRGPAGVRVCGGARTAGTRASAFAAATRRWNPTRDRLRVRDEKRAPNAAGGAGRCCRGRPYATWQPPPRGLQARSGCSGKVKRLRPASCAPSMVLPAAHGATVRPQTVREAPDAAASLAPAEPLTGSTLPAALRAARSSGRHSSRCCSRRATARRRDRARRLAAACGRLGYRFDPPRAQLVAAHLGRLPPGAGAPAPGARLRSRLRRRGRRVTATGRRARGGGARRAPAAAARRGARVALRARRLGDTQRPPRARGLHGARTTNSSASRRCALPGGSATPTAAAPRKAPPSQPARARRQLRVPARARPAPSPRARPGPRALPAAASSRPESVSWWPPHTRSTATRRAGAWRWKTRRGAVGRRRAAASAGGGTRGALAQGNGAAATTPRALGERLVKTNLFETMRMRRPQAAGAARGRQVRKRRRGRRRRPAARRTCSPCCARS